MKRSHIEVRTYTYIYLFRGTVYIISYSHLAQDTRTHEGIVREGAMRALSRHGGKGRRAAEGVGNGEGCLSREFSARTRWPVLRSGLIPNKNMRDIFAGLAETRDREPARERTPQKGKRGCVCPAMHDVFCFRLARAEYSPRWIVAVGDNVRFVCASTPPRSANRVTAFTCKPGDR